MLTHFYIMPTLATALYNAHLEHPGNGESETGGVVDQEVLRGPEAKGHDGSGEDEDRGPEELLE